MNTNVTNLSDLSKLFNGLNLTSSTHGVLMVDCSRENLTEKTAMQRIIDKINAISTVSEDWNIVSSSPVQDLQIAVKFYNQKEYTISVKLLSKLEEKMISDKMKESKKEEFNILQIRVHYLKGCILSGAVHHQEALEKNLSEISKEKISLLDKIKKTDEKLALMNIAMSELVLAKGLIPKKREVNTDSTYGGDTVTQDLTDGIAINQALADTYLYHRFYKKVKETHKEIIEITKNEQKMLKKYNNKEKSPHQHQYQLGALNQIYSDSCLKLSEMFQMQYDDEHHSDKFLKKATKYFNKATANKRKSVI